MFKVKVDYDGGNEILVAEVVVSSLQFIQYYDLTFSKHKAMTYHLLNQWSESTFHESIYNITSQVSDISFYTTFYKELWLSLIKTVAILHLNIEGSGVRIT